MLAGCYWLVQFAGGGVAALLLKWVLPSAAQNRRTSACRRSAAGSAQGRAS